MSNATFTFGRFNPPTEEGHGKLVSAVQQHAEKTSGTHYVFPSHSQDAKKNPLSHNDKVGAMQKLFPNANIVSHGKVRTAIDAMKHLEKKGHTNVTMVVGSDRVAEFHGLLSKYRKKEFPGIKKVNVVSAGNRDPDAEGAEGMSASKLRGLVAAGKKKEFVSHYSDPKLGAHIHDKVKAGMQMESVNPVGIFLLGGPGSGKDYVLKNIFSRFDLTEVQADQLLNGAADELIREGKNIVINGVSDSAKITEVQTILEQKQYVYDYVHVSVTNKVSRLRNEQREQPLVESKRIDKFLKAEELARNTEAFIFNNSINLNESSEMERVFFGAQIEKLLERVVELGLEIKTTPEPKAFSVIKEKYFPPVAKDKASGLPKKYVRGLSASTAKARAAHWREKSKLSDSDPRAYEPAPGDATAKTKPSKHTIAVRKMMGEQMTADVKVPHTVEDIAAKHKVSVAEIIQALTIGKQVEMEHTNDENTAEIIALAHLWEKPDYYTQLAKMEQVAKPVDHVAIEKKAERERRIRDTRVLTHQNRHIHQAAMGEAIRRVPRSGNVTAVMKKRELNDAERAGFEQAKMQLAANKVQEASSPAQQAAIAIAMKKAGKKPKNEEVIDEGAADSSLSAKAAKSGISVGTLRKVYKRGVAAWNSGHRPGTTPQQWGHARVNSYINKGKTYHTADKDLREDTDINDLFEMQLMGTDEYRKHAIAMTPGQSQEIANAFSDDGKVDVKTVQKTESECGCGGNCQCNGQDGSGNNKSDRKFSEFRKGVKEAKEKDGKDDGVETQPTLTTKHKKGALKGPNHYDYTLQGLPITARFNALEQVTVEEAIEYHLTENISFTENAFRPGSEMFFEMISEAKRLYKEGKYTPKDEWEKDMLESNIGEIAEFEGQQVVLDYPIEEGLEECWKGYTQRGMKKRGDKMVPNCVPVNEADDPTDGKGIGKPFRSGGGGAVYVRVGDGVRKINFSQSGMTKKYMDPAATRSFVARHHCLTNKDKTSRSYWACRWPRFFSNSGKTWW